MRDITFTNNSVTNTTMTLQTSVTSFGGFCVHEAVPVNCKEYYKHISELEVGDMVMSYNFETDSIIFFWSMLRKSETAIAIAAFRTLNSPSIGS